MVSRSHSTPPSHLPPPSRQRSKSRWMMPKYFSVEGCETWSLQSGVSASGWICGAAWSKAEWLVTVEEEWGMATSEPPPAPPFIARSSKRCWHFKESLFKGTPVSECFQGAWDQSCHHRESDQPDQWWMLECGPVLKQRKNELRPEVLYSWRF